MKSLLSTIAIFMLLAQLITGNWYVRKCANRTGNCRKTCRNGEMEIDPPTGMCPKEKLCCILSPIDVNSPVACVEPPKTTIAAETGAEAEKTTQAGSGSENVNATATPAAGSMSATSPATTTAAAS